MVIGEESQSLSLKTQQKVRLASQQPFKSGLCVPQTQPFTVSCSPLSRRRKPGQGSDSEWQFIHHSKV